uniref:Stimulated by retinoic acid gene 6 protein-like n=1 Tax=Knipowitschia caucasica TaxID=637954 RepID=A0AAV2LKT2_KNICA
MFWDETEQGDADVEPVVPKCEDALTTIFLHFTLIPAVVIVGVLSLLQRRAKTHAIDQSLPFLQRRFGIVIPMDAMGFSNRWSYGFAFGAIYYSVLELIYDQHMTKYFKPWAFAIAYLIGGFEVGMAYFPLFACLSTPYVRTGAVMGIFYSIMWIILVGWDWYTCSDGMEWGRYQKLIYQWPRMLSLIFLLVRYVFVLINAVRKENNPEQKPMHAHLKEHVKRLLRREAVCSKSLNWFQRNIYEWDPHFKFPNRIIGTCIISFLVLYTFVFKDLEVSIYAYNKWFQGLSLDFLQCFYVTIVSASLHMGISICHVLACYRKHIKRLWKGQKDFIPKKLQNLDPAVSLGSIAKYSGWQIAFNFWGYAIGCAQTDGPDTCAVKKNASSALCFLRAVMPLRIAAVHAPLSLGLQSFFQSTIVPGFVGFALIFVIFKLQDFLVQLFFLQDKLSQTDEKKPLALNNRKAFYCFNYFFFFYNVAMGITSCFIRIMISIVLGSFLVARIDRSILQKGYETFDRGYKTWVGMILADHNHNNPVMVCFIELLLSHVQEKQFECNYTEINSPLETCCVMKRWRLLYTLLKNPQLIPLRKQHLRAKVPLKLKSSTQADVVVQAWLMRSETATEMVNEQCKAV